MHREGLSWRGLRIRDGQQWILEQAKCGFQAGVVSDDEQWVVQARTLPGDLKHQLCEELRWQRQLPGPMESTGPWRAGKPILECSLP